MEYRQLVSRRLKWFTLIFGLPLFLCASARADGAVDSQCLLVESAFAANDLNVLESLDLLDPRWQALQSFRLAAIHIPADDKPRARRAVRSGLEAVKQGLNRVDKVVDQDTLLADPIALQNAHSERAELLLLGAMLDGQFLLIDRWRLFRHGWRGLRRLRQAEALSENNTRALLVRGTAKVVAPWALGGSAEEAIALFEQADLSSTLCENGEWAQVDVLNWLGRAYEKLDNKARAQAAYEAALKRSPGNHWVHLALSGNGYEWTEHGEPDAPESGN